MIDGSKEEDRRTEEDNKNNSRKIETKTKK